VAEMIPHRGELVGEFFDEFWVVGDDDVFVFDHGGGAGSVVAAGEEVAGIGDGEFVESFYFREPSEDAGNFRMLMDHLPFTGAVSRASSWIGRGRMLLRARGWLQSGLGCWARIRRRMKSH
jgi:hypothetical protein